MDYRELPVLQARMELRAQQAQVGLMELEQRVQQDQPDQAVVRLAQLEQQERPGQ